MNKSREDNGNGNGNGAHGLLQRQKKQAGEPSSGLSAAEFEKSKVTAQTHDDVKLTGEPIRITRHQIVFEIFNPAVVLQLSEALDKFSIILQGRTVYSGRAVISNVVSAGARTVCEATLDETHWTDLNQILALQKEGQIAREFKMFLKDWQKAYTVLPEFKVVIADMQTFLTDLRFWLERMELTIRGMPPNSQREYEQETMEEVGKSFVPAFDTLHERLESISQNISEESRPAHRLFAQRQLHPLTLCSPFARRAYGKPLGYAGDYEMVNMIALNPYKGDSLYAKIVNLWFLSQWPSKAHRNRLSYLQERLEEETCRVIHTHRKAQIFNFACGPAIEVQRFLANLRLCDQVELTLTDFSQETLEYVAKAAKSIKERLSIETSIHLQRKSVYQVLKEDAAKPGKQKEYDFVYCAGLFDYLPNTTCKHLMETFYSWLAPGGLLAVTNVVDNRPFRHMLEFVLDWHLIYRDPQEAESVIPASIPEDARSVKIDPTGVNIFIEARKPRA